MPYADSTLRSQGLETVRVPGELHFSGQGDALPCGNYLFAGYGYRSDKAVHSFLADTLGYEVISLQAVPQRKWFGLGPAVINKASGWPDSFYYDIDLAISVLRSPSGSQKGLIAWCPAAFTPASRQLLRDFDGVDKIEVSLKEARKAFACNLVSTGEKVIMSARAPQLRAAIEARGLQTITPEITELAKGGGYIRCTTLTLDNE
jgi:N-dimethylarginine dimethylaminohydrolase